MFRRVRIALVQLQFQQDLDREDAYVEEEPGELGVWGHLPRGGQAQRAITKHFDDIPTKSKSSECLKEQKSAQMRRLDAAMLP